MARVSLISKSWYGDRITIQASKAMVRGTSNIAGEAAEIAKELVDVISGDLQRSIHSAHEDYDGSGDLQLAQSGIDLQQYAPASTFSVFFKHTGVDVLFGSWLDYAIVEEEYRQHEFLEPALDMVARQADGIMVAAWKTEGL